VTSEGDLVHFALLIEVEQMNNEEATKHDLWKVAMLEELHSIVKT